MDTDKRIDLYRHMYRSRIFEESVVGLWNDGHITGEMHTGIGEEAIIAGVLSHLKEGDALALDHRPTSAALMRGLPPRELILEFLGHTEGLGSGMGGHMHVLSKEHLFASSGIVGSSGPAAAGFALAAQHLRPGNAAVAFFGEGAANQGMLMESLNLASVLDLPVLFVCKDSGMAITTVSSTVTAGNLAERARSFDMPADEIDGSDVELVYRTAGDAIEKARSGGGPSFILAHCFRPDGHMLGDPVHRIVDNPARELSQISGPLMKSTLRRSGASLKERLGSVRDVLSLLRKTASDRSGAGKDPLAVLRKKPGIDPEQLRVIEEEVSREVETVIDEVLQLYSENTAV